MTSSVTHIVVFDLWVFWVKTLINYGNDHSFASDISLPNINHIICGLSITSILGVHKVKEKDMFSTLNCTLLN